MVWKTTCMAVLLALLVLAGCPSEEGDDDSAIAGDDDDTVADSAPVISNLDLFIATPQGETEEMLNFSFDYEDADGDVADGFIRLFSSLEQPLDDADYAGQDPLEDIEDATSGTLSTYGDIGGFTGFPVGEAWFYGVVLEDRAGNESNMLEAEFTIVE
jgi:hypothetical protein